MDRPHQLIYRKPSTLTREALSRFTEGELVSLMTADCQAYLEVGQFFFFFAAMPFQALLSASLLLWLLGAPFLIGLAVLVLNVVVVERLGNRIRDAQRAKSKHADARGVLVNESLQGARTVKLYAWEAVVAKRVAAVRAKEEAQLVRIAPSAPPSSFCPSACRPPSPSPCSSCTSSSTTRCPRRRSSPPSRSSSF